MSRADCRDAALRSLFRRTAGGTAGSNAEQEDSV